MLALFGIVTWAFDKDGTRYLYDVVENENLREILDLSHFRLREVEEEDIELYVSVDTEGGNFTQRERTKLPLFMGFAQGRRKPCPCTLIGNQTVALEDLVALKES